MKKIIFMPGIFSFIHFAATAQTKTTLQQQEDPVKAKKHKAQTRQHVVRGRRARMRLQLQQVRQHKKGLKEVDSVQKKLNKELHKPHQ